MNLSVIGLGKLGACTASCFASKGFKVTGVDVNKNYVEAINRGEAPVEEPGLQELITKAHNNLSATQSYEEAIANSDVTFLIVPTPSRSDHHFSDTYLLEALEQLAAGLKKPGKNYHTFVITSTVSPGTTEARLIPAIEKISGKKLNEGFDICYNPEFIALGSVIRDFLNPDLVLIGESNPAAGEKLEKIYVTVCDNKPHIARMSVVSAEITKISLNSFVTMKISFANTLANLCESIPNASIDDITKALGADKRISPYYLKGGLSFGGPCFPRDNRAFSAFASMYGVEAALAKATDVVNENHAQYISKKILHYAAQQKSKSVAILGLSYKPNTPVIEESPAMRIIEELLNHDLTVTVFDPLALQSVKGRFGEKILYASSVRDCFFNSSICVIATQANEFRAIDASYIQHNPTIIIDCWRILSKDKLGSKTQYIELGRPAL